MSDAPHLVQRSFKFRLLPRKGQHVRLRQALEHTRELYNAALEERVGAWRKAGRSLGFSDQSRGITAYRALDPTPWAHGMQCWPLMKVDLAFKAFYRRVKAGAASVGFPRFRGRDRFNTFGFTNSYAWKLTGSRLYMKGIGNVRIHLHRELPATPKSCVIGRDGKGWFVTFPLELPVAALPSTGASVGIDLGLTSFAAMSTGETIPSPRVARAVHAEMRRRQRALSRCVRGSARRRKVKAGVVRLHQRVRDARLTFHNQVATHIVRRFDLIAVENLNVHGLAKGMLARSVHDAGWGQFLRVMSEKAERAARLLVKVDARRTSQTCPACGQVRAKDLSERVHRCECGLELDRDVAAARVILHRAITGPGAPNLRVA